MTSRNRTGGPSAAQSRPEPTIALTAEQVDRMGELALAAETPGGLRDALVS